MDGKDLYSVDEWHKVVVQASSSESFVVTKEESMCIYHKQSVVLPLSLRAISTLETFEVQSTFIPLSLFFKCVLDVRLLNKVMTFPLIYFELSQF